MPIPRTMVVDDSDEQIRYFGSGWVHEPPASYDTQGNFGPTYEHTIHSTTASASLTFSFKGTSVRPVGPTNVAGISTWDCYVDDVEIPAVKPFIARENNWELCHQSSLTNGQHEFKIDVTSQGPTFAFDFIEYTPFPWCFSGFYGCEGGLHRPSPPIRQRLERD